MASSNSSPRVPSDLAPDPGLTYNPARSLLRTVLATEPAIPGSARSGRSGAKPVEAGETHGEVFELRKQLAQGGFGDVWCGVQTTLDREVAIKRLREDRIASAKADDLWQLEEMFRHEALTTAKLEHPNIVPVYELGADDTGQALLAMKLVRGRPWSELIREDMAADLEADALLSKHLPILIDVAQAVAYAHSRGILHRDLKPQQVMVGEFGEVLLMDWGLALPFGENGAIVPGTTDADTPSGSGDSTAVTAPAGLAGTPSFMAPEQTRGVPEEIGPWTDLYLLGGTLYCLLTGSPPHRARDSMAAFVKASNGEIEPPSERAPDRHIPAELRRLALGTLEPQPAQRRPESVQEFILALEEYLSGASRKRRSRAIVYEAAEHASTEDDYSELGHRLSKLQQAQALWPENPDVARLRHKVLKGYSEAALAKNDLALARLQAGQLATGPDRTALFRRVDHALSQRRAVARQRRLALIALAVLAVLMVVGALKFARDQRRAAEQLAVERDAAREARADASGLMTFMLEDQWQSLLRIQRVDLLAPVARRAESYYSERDPSTLSIAEQANRGATFSTIGQTLQYQGDVEGAIRAYRQAGDVFRQLTASEPENLDYLLKYLGTLEDLSLALNDLGDKETALEVLSEHRRRCEAALAERLEDPDLEGALLTGFDIAGIVLYDLGKLEEAGAHFAQALALAEKARRAESPDADLSDLSSGIEMRLAVTQMDAGELDSALASIEHSIELAEESIRLDPSRARVYLGVSQAIRARILSGLGRGAEAAQVLKAALPEVRRLVDEDPTNAEKRYALTNLDLELGNIESNLGNADAARAAWERVVDTVEPLRDTTDLSYLLDSLVRALLQLGRVDEARPFAARLLAKNWSHQDFQELCRSHGLMSEG